MHASVNRQLLARLACAPDPDAGTGWTREHAQRVRCIRAYVEGAHARNETAIAIEALMTWRVSLDRSLAELGDDVDGWSAWCWPNTWLDHHLRLRALLVHLLSVWNGLALVPWADMNVPDFLWGPHKSLLGPSRVDREPR
jgi:hypothetical protein